MASSPCCAILWPMQLAMPQEHLGPRAFLACVLVINTTLILAIDVYVPALPGLLHESFRHHGIVSQPHDVHVHVRLGLRDSRLGTACLTSSGGKPVPRGELCDFRRLPRSAARFPRRCSCSRRFASDRPWALVWSRPMSRRSSRMPMPTRTSSSRCRFCSRLSSSAPSSPLSSGRCC